MPIHDWTRVDAATFHAFHSSWITHLMEALNDGLLPPGFYALSEQVASRMQTDVLALRAPATGAVLPGGRDGGVAVLETPPNVHFKVRPDPDRKPRRTTRQGRRLVVRHTSGHQVVAVIEIASAANKDRRDSVRDFAGKVVSLLESGVRVLVIDLLPPGRYDSHGLHGAVWGAFDTTPYEPPADAPLTIVAYNWDGQEPEAFIEPTAVGRALIDMPLFLTAERYVNVPLESTYQAAFRGIPEIFRDALTAPDS